MCLRSSCERRVEPSAIVALALIVHSFSHASITFAEELNQSPLFGGFVWERSKLSGDWRGCRTAAMLDHGITLDVSTTQFYQGVASGGLERSFPYGGRNDYFLKVDGETLGLWEGLAAHVRGETRYGESPNFITGALSPVNEYLLVPAKEGSVTALTAVYFTQSLSENAFLSIGKINLLDRVTQPLTGATGLDGFMNTSLLFNTILARTLPYSTLGAEFLYKKDGGASLTFWIFDTNSTPTTSGFESLFDNGVLLFGEINIPTHFRGRPGHQGVSMAYSTGKYTNLSPSPYLDPVDGLVFASPRKAGSWAAAYNIDHALYVDPCNPKRLWGLFAKLGIADDNPNPVHWYASAGLSGSSPLRRRSLDTFGVGYFQLGVSSVLKEFAQPLTPLRNEQGVELYYNARVTPWCQVTPALQVLDPFQSQVDTTVTFGLRAKIDF